LKLFNIDLTQIEKKLQIILIKFIISSKNLFNINKNKLNHSEFNDLIFDNSSFVLNDNKYELESVSKKYLKYKMKYLERFVFSKII
jgi:hypothetical protein